MDTYKDQDHSYDPSAQAPRPWERALIHYAARTHAGRHVACFGVDIYDDLVAAGFHGWWLACRGFDPTKGGTWRGYLWRTVTGTVQREKTRWRGIRKNVQPHVGNINAAIQSLGTVSRSQIAAHTGLPLEVVEAAQRYREVSTETPLTPGNEPSLEGSTLGSSIPDPGRLSDEHVYRAQIVQHVRDAVEGLPTENERMLGRWVLSGRSMSELHREGHLGRGSVGWARKSMYRRLRHRLSHLRDQ